MKKSEMNIEKSEVRQLDDVLSSVKVGKLSNEDVYKLLENKIELSKRMKEIRDAIELAKEELKPDGLKEKISEEVKNRLEATWTSKFNEFYFKFSKEVVAVNLQKISKDVLIDIVKENNLTFGGMELLNRYMV